MTVHLEDTEKLNFHPLAAYHMLLWTAGKKAARVYGMQFIAASQRFKFSLHTKNLVACPQPSLPL